MSNWEEKKALAAIKGTCPHHLKHLLVNGRCVKCDINEARRQQKAKDSNTCPLHPEVKATRDKCHLCKESRENRRNARIALGVCPKHKDITTANGDCSKCLEIRALNEKIALETDTCVSHVGIKLINGFCPSCVTYRKTKRDNCTSLKICIQHPTISIAEEPCPTCKAKYDTLKENSLKNKVCFYHPNEPAVSGMMCLDCWCASIASDALGSKKHKEVVKQSFYGSPYCVYTGAKLAPGHEANSASFDHVITRSRGGLRILENCQWAQLRVNVSKNDRTRQEYLTELLTIHNNINCAFSPLAELTTLHMWVNPEYTECLKCVESRRDYKRSPLAIRSYCKQHYFEAVSLKHFNTTRHAKDLEELFLRQGGVCAYMRTPLVLGSPGKMSKATIDHLIPPKRGGDQKDILNVHWVSSRINTLKQDMTHNELLSFVALIVSRFAADPISGLILPISPNIG